MPVNAGYEYANAEKKYSQATNLEERIVALQEMIKTAPKHKSSENLLAELKTRLKKFREKSEKAKKVGGGKKGLKKEGYQIALVGRAGVGKSSLLAALTNARPLISPHPFTTKEPEVGTLNYEGVRAQVVDLPAAEGVGFDIGLANTADCILLVLDSTKDFNEVLDFMEKLLVSSRGSSIIVFNKIDLLDSTSLRKLKERCKSKRLPAAFVSSVSKEGIGDLKKAIFHHMKVIRVYMKEPGKPATTIPAVLREGSSVKDVAESIRTGFSRTVTEARITGPSGKFSNQKVGLGHVLKDRDVVEFHTK